MFDEAIFARLAEGSSYVWRSVLCTFGLSVLCPFGGGRIVCLPERAFGGERFSYVQWSVLRLLGEASGKLPRALGLDTIYGTAISHTHELIYVLNEIVR